MIRKALRVLLPLSLALVVVGPALPASAQAPFKETFVDEGIFTLPDIACSGFNLHEEMVSEDVRTTTYFDNAGNPVKVATKANFLGVITNSANGNTTRDHATFTETLDLSAGTDTVSGVSYHYMVAGKGEVYAEVGHKILVTDTGEVTFQAGQDDFTQTDLAGICDGLA
ncbi:MAG: hypothetical protein M3O84_05510 [Actinomycetota bacterium]|nr:hypothetical protein [Actinomycetota bacterium]